jgi:hypothetical protein
LGPLGPVTNTKRGEIRREERSMVGRVLEGCAQ